MTTTNEAFHVMTKPGKAALAKSLAKHDPAYLSDLTMIAKKLGPFAGVWYLSNSPVTQEKVVADVAAARLAYNDNAKARRTAPRVNR